MKVLVVTGVNLGWDCVVGVWANTPQNLVNLREEYPYPEYVITERTLEHSVETESTLEE